MGIGALKDVQVAVCGFCCVYLNNDTLKILGTEAFLLEIFLGPAKIFVCLYALFSCLHTYMLSSEMKRENRTIENRIPFKTFKKWSNISYHYVSYIKSETSDIWIFDIQYSMFPRSDLSP